MLAHAQKHLIQLPLAGMVLLFAATAADAQISYVGPAGHDANPCTRAAAHAGHCSGASTWSRRAAMS